MIQIWTHNFVYSLRQKDSVLFCQEENLNLCIEWEKDKKTILQLSVWLSRSKTRRRRWNSSRVRRWPIESNRWWGTRWSHWHTTKPRWWSGYWGVIESWGTIGRWWEISRRGMMRRRGKVLRRLHVGWHWAKGHGNGGRRWWWTRIWMTCWLSRVTRRLAGRAGWRATRIWWMLIVQLRVWVRMCRWSTGMCWWVRRHHIVLRVVAL